MAELLQLRQILPEDDDKDNILLIKDAMVQLMVHDKIVVCNDREKLIQLLNGQASLPTKPDDW